MDILSAIIYAILFFILCFAKFILYPFYCIVVYANIVYLSIIAFLFFMIAGWYLLKKYYLVNRFTIIPLILAGLMALGLSSYLEASLFIRDVAKYKYYAVPTHLDINLEQWTDCTFFGDAPRGCTHAEIEIDSKRYYWSFEKRDFVKAESGLSRCY